MAITVFALIELDRVVRGVAIMYSTISYPMKGFPWISTTEKKVMHNRFPTSIIEFTKLDRFKGARLKISLYIEFSLKTYLLQAHTTL